MNAPAWLALPEIETLVAGKGAWIAERLERMAETRNLLDAETKPPQAITLPALAESWQVEYRRAAGGTVVARASRPGGILVSGPVTDNELCRAALRQWLVRRAKEILNPWLEDLAAETGLRFSRLSVRNQRTRWGSCSAAGAISLNCKLLFLPADLVRYVLVHELCHLREHNHTNRYWTLLRQHEPEAAALHRRIREAWSLIPGWAHPRRNPVIPGGPPVRNSLF